MLRKIFIILAVFLCMIPANAQDCYNYTRNQGISFYNKGDYNAAKVRFIGAKDCPDKPSDNDLDSWIKKCDTALAEKRQREEEERKRRETERKYEYKGYMNIHNVEFKNGDSETTINKYGEEISAVDAKYIYPRVYYSGLANTSKDIQIYVKIIKPDGSLMRGKSSPEGYTYSKDITVSPNSYQYLYLSGWGNKSGGAYVAGTHTFQLWYNGRMIYQQNFTLKGPKGASYLTINNKTSVSHSFPSSGGTETFYISTDSDGWQTWGVPSFCEIIDKTSTSFTLRCNSNSNSSTRSDYMKVKSGDKEVRIDIYQESGSGVTIKKVWTDYNIWHSNQKGMMIHINFTANGLKNHKIEVAAYFMFSDGTSLNDYDGYYHTTDGKVSTGDTSTVTYDSSRWDDYQLFMPYEQLHLGSGSYSLKFMIQIHDKTTGKTIAVSEDQEFTIS
ncbi:MAG: hypothetical protein NC308_00835 [Clostridium sp.]|nr:hypothetical protein [Bacteroides sp.]MCM1197409.1 hypothetical protein [Clostridium sp.]